MSNKMVFLGLGVFFGFSLSRVGASNYDLIFAMFAGEDLTLAWVIITAIITAFLGMKLIALIGGKGYKGQKITVNKKPLNQFTVPGGILFGIGWAISGACPGTVLAQVGEGKTLGLFTMLGMIAGTYIYALLVNKHPKLSS